jgi:peptidoglycan/xylan/chitin deacetylase (PgdA/CDA1 family)
MKTFVRIIFLAVVFGVAGYYTWYFWGRHLSWNDLVTYNDRPAPIGRLTSDPLGPLGLRPSDLEAPGGEEVRFLRKSTYLNNARAVVTHTIDDSSEFVKPTLDAMDKYGIKATIFVSTEQEPISSLWPRLQQAITNGHEIGSHSRRHQCQWPDTFLFCVAAYTDYEVTGSQHDILSHTSQPYVWAWAYPCGNCADREFVQRKLARAGYLVARPYPGEEQDLHNLPDLQTYDTNPYYARYTQVVQKRGGIAKSGRTNVPELNAKFDEVYQRGGIYSFLSHPQWLDLGPDKFYEQHLAHVSRRQDVWYVPMGPLYAYQTVREETQVRRLEPQDALARFAVYDDLDPKIFTTSVTLEFSVSTEAKKLVVRASGKPLPEKALGLTDRWDVEYYRREGQSVFVTLRPGTILAFQ